MTFSKRLILTKIKLKPTFLHKNNRLIKLALYGKIVRKRIRAYNMNIQKIIQTNSLFIQLKILECDDRRKTKKVIETTVRTWQKTHFTAPFLGQNISKYI